MDFVYGYPVIHPNRNEIVKKLQEKDIEVRPMICGSMGTQPFYTKKYGRKRVIDLEEIKRRCIEK